MTLAISVRPHPFLESGAQISMKNTYDVALAVTVL